MWLISTFQSEDWWFIFLCTLVWRNLRLLKNEVVFVKNEIEFEDLYSWINEAVNGIFSSKILNTDVIESEIKKGFIKYLVEGFVIEENDDDDILNDKDVVNLYNSSKDTWIIKKVNELVEIKINKKILEVV